jgi:hypothetical protein
VKDGATDKETRGTDHVTRLGVTIRGLLLGVSVRGVSCLVLGLVLRERRDKTGKEETLHTVWAGQTCKAGGTGKTDKAPANSRTRDRSIMPLRHIAGRGWRGPSAIIFIGVLGQLSAGILAG